MPYIAVSTTRSLDKPQMEALKTGLGQLITLLPGKTEQVLMVDLSGGHTMYFAGEEMAHGAYVDVRCYGSIPFAPKAAFTEAVFQLLKETLGLAPEQVYVSVGEFGTWGLRGMLK